MDNVLNLIHTIPHKHTFLWITMWISGLLLYKFKYYTILIIIIQNMTNNSGVLNACSKKEDINSFKHFNDNNYIVNYSAFYIVRLL